MKYAQLDRKESKPLSIAAPLVLLLFTTHLERSFAQVAPTPCDAGAGFARRIAGDLSRLWCARDSAQLSAIQTELQESLNAFDAQVVAYRRFTPANGDARWNNRAPGRFPRETVVLNPPNELHPNPSHLDFFACFNATIHQAGFPGLRAIYRTAPFGAQFGPDSQWSALRTMTGTLNPPSETLLRIRAAVRRGNGRPPAPAPQMSRAVDLQSIRNLFGSHGDPDCDSNSDSGSDSGSGPGGSPGGSWATNGHVVVAPPITAGEHAPLEGTVSAIGVVRSGVAAGVTIGLAAGASAAGTATAGATAAPLTRSLAH
jgi:hypothetical protein